VLLLLRGKLTRKKMEAAMVNKEVVQVPGLKAIGTYSQAIRARGLLFVSGQPGVDPASGEAVGPGLEA
jgi:enamine deaminase RidA (YjgF/YER057c/UK114 family)